MSRTFVRRLAAVALLAVLCFTLPAAAAAPRHTVKAPATAPSLWGAILSWVGNFLGAPSPAGAAERAKPGTIPPILNPSGLSNTTTLDASIGSDPNGHS